jgi:4-hydroxybenzoate polyprenyltransferase
MIEASLPALQWPTPDPKRTWLSLLALTLFNAGGNQINSVFDWEIDLINKPTRPIPRGLLSRVEALGFGLGLMGLAALLCLSRLSSPSFVVLAFSILGLTLAYSIPPIRLKKHLWVNVVTQAIIRGILGPLAAWCVYGFLTPSAYGIAIVMFFFILAAQSSKDFPDMRGDAIFGIKTLPVTYGVEGAIKIVRGLLPLPIIAQIILIWTGVLPPQTAWSLVITTPLIILFGYWIRDTKENPYVENGKAWVCFYACMISILLGFAVTL